MTAKAQPKQRRQSWTTDTPTLEVDRTFVLPPARPRSEWAQRRLVPLLFLSRVVVPVPLEGERWTVGYFSTPADKLGSVLLSPLPEDTAIGAVLAAGGYSEADIPESARAIVAPGRAAFCSAATSFPWVSAPASNDALPRQVATRSRLVLIVLGLDDLNVGDTVNVAGASVEFASQIIDPLTGTVIADHPRVLRIGEGRAEPAFLAEVSFGRQTDGNATVKRVAALDLGLEVGTVVTTLPPLTTAQVDAHRRAMVVAATVRARALHPTGRLANVRVEHELELIAGSGIGATPADFKAALAMPPVSEPSARDVSWLRAIYRWKNLPVSRRRVLPSPSAASAAWAGFVRGEVLLKLGGREAWTPGAVVPVVEPIKPSTREATLPFVSSCYCFPYEADARTSHVQRVKGRSGAPGSLSSVSSLAELEASGYANDFRTIRPQAAVAMAAEIGHQKANCPAVIKQLAEVARIKGLRDASKASASKKSGWDKNGSLRWACAMVCKLYIENISRKSRSFGDFVKCLGEAEGISKLRWEQLSPSVSEALLGEPAAFAARCRIAVTRPHEDSADLQRLRFFFADGPAGTTLEDMWTRLDDGRQYTYRGAGLPVAPLDDRVTLRGLDGFGRTKPPTLARETANTIVALALGESVCPATAAPSAPPWARGAAIEVLECARLLHYERPGSTGTSAADRADARQSGIRRQWAKAVCMATLDPPLWERLSGAWNL